MEKDNVSRSGYLSKFHEVLRLPRKVTLKLHQILRLPRKMNLMIDPHHIWNVIYNARSKQSQPPTSPNTAPAFQRKIPVWNGYSRLWIMFFELDVWNLHPHEVFGSVFFDCSKPSASGIIALAGQARASCTPARISARLTRSQHWGMAPQRPPPRWILGINSAAATNKSLCS